MVTVFDKEGNAIELDGCDARERVSAGLAFTESPVSEKKSKQVKQESDLKEISKMTNKELKAELDAAGVEYKTNETKYDLQALVTGARAE
ncbi:MAG: hypothetical protein WC322_02665 [Candidatus Paceibacterota bacterium]|jgi:hypothetical protein